MRHTIQQAAFILVLGSIPLIGQTSPSAQYQIYAGNTHSHTAYTWSHGDQFTNNGCQGAKVYKNIPPSDILFTWSNGFEPNKKIACPGMLVINSWQYPSPDITLKSDWQELQGPPAEHFALAKAQGFDFYTTSDHSQDGSFMPPGPNNPAWLNTKQAAAHATDAGFVALAGFEYSDNDGPGGVGHINVINSADILNALLPGVNLPYFYKWLTTARPNGDGPIVASFNHPSADQYNDWDYRDAAVTDLITMLEVINSNSTIHYEGFINALDKGWKVSPVSGIDNHGLSGISKAKSRTFVLAKTKSKAAILEAMKNRRTYASLDENIQCRYTVNGEIMGSTLMPSKELKFHIVIRDPDTNNPNDKITKLDIVTDGGAVVQTYEPSPDYSAEWSPVIPTSTHRYFFVRVWNAGGGDAPKADPAKPIAWLAPVWIQR